MEPPRVPGGIQEKVTTSSWITVGHPQMCLGHPCSWLLESFPCKTCESLQELGPANIFQICTWPPRCSPHSLITVPGAAGSRPWPLPLPPHARASSAVPGASYTNAVLRKSWAECRKTSFFTIQQIFQRPPNGQRRGQRCLHVSVGTACLRPGPGL